MPGDAYLPPFAEPFLSPERAIVTPRATRAPDGTAALPLEELVRPMIESAPREVVSLAGPPGSGKRTALRHLRERFAHLTDVVYLHNPPFAELQRECSADARSARVIVCAVEQHLAGNPIRLNIAPWTDDDVVAYAAAVHRPRCRSVLSRVMADADRALLQGRPLLWEIVLDAMAIDDRLTSVMAALRMYAIEAIGNPEAWEQATRLAAHVLADPALNAATVVPAGATYELKQLLQQPAIHLILSGSRLVRAITHDDDVMHLPKLLLKPELIREAAAQLPVSVDAARALRGAIITGKATVSEYDVQRSSLAASLLLKRDRMWRPRDGAMLQVPGAMLAGARWKGIDLCGANLGGTDLRRADLTQAYLPGALLLDANLCGATLSGANISHAIADTADFSQARMEMANAKAAQLRGAVLREANLTGAVFREAILTAAKLDGARLRHVDLSWATLCEAAVAGADFTDALLREAVLDGIDFSGALLDGARFRGAKLIGCRFEGVEVQRASFRDAELTGSYLTGSSMPGADFRGAKLNDTGLAEIDWPDADLRDADLRGASFHLGSSRSGLVGSTIACEGSRTGFYTDDFDEQDFKDPAEIRKANLCGADLRGANIEGVDFYLVDLRGARYTAEQARHFRRCGAILHSRAA
jgi:uncharacterized protein YjbI with pentapeptide repeats